MTAAYADKTLVVCKQASPAGFDPAQYMTYDDLTPSEPIFDRLVTFERGTMTILPSLATKWDISKDGRTITFTLRKGVKFHTTDYFKPTRDFNADDVVFTFSRAINPRHLFRLAYPGEFPNIEDKDRNLLKVVKVDPYTVQFILRKPEASTLNDLAATPSSIYSFEYAQQLYKQRRASEIAQKPIGTGPFAFKNHLLNQKIHYVANKSYWDKRPENQVKLDGLIFAITKEQAVQVKKLKAGECHIMDNVPALDIQKFQKDPNFVVYKKTGLNVWHITYNTQKIKKLLVRQALDMAINRKQIVDVFRGFAQELHNGLPRIQWGTDLSIKNEPYNPTKAKQLLKQAGYPNGFELKLFIYLGGSPANDLIAQIIQNNWAKIGVKTKLTSYEAGEYFKRAYEGEHDAIFSGGAGNNGDPSNFLGIYTCESLNDGTSLARWCHKPFDDLLDKGRYSLDRAQRLTIYQQAQKMLKQHVVFSPLHSKMDVHIAHKSVKGYVLPLLTPQQYTGITIQ